MGDVSNTKRDGDSIAVTDSGNYIIDLFFSSPLLDVREAARELLSIPGG